MDSTIERTFHEQGIILNEKLLAECLSICKTYGITEDSLLYKIQSISFKSVGQRPAFTAITMDTLSEAKKRIQQDIAKANAPKAKIQGLTLAAQVDRSRFPNQKFAPKAPAAVVKQEQVAESSSSSLALSSRSTANVTFSGPSADPDAKMKRAYRYMYEKISERSGALDQIIDDFSDLIRHHYDLKSEFGDPSASTDEEVVIVGRITHDSETAGISRLVEGAIFIESSRMLSGGARVPLKFEPAIKIRGAVKDVGGFGLFPGQIVAFKGKNGGGGYFLATEYLSIPPLKPSPAAHGIINPKLGPMDPHNSASILVACGPFSNDSDLGYKPWRNLLQQIKANKPDVVLLVGPFLDSTHPKIKVGDTDVSPSKIFKAHFIDPMTSFLTLSPGSIVLLVPSVRDLMSDHAAFPQPEFSGEPAHPGIHFLPNPARFTINDISFATTSIDTLFHLRKEEYFKPCFKRGVEINSLDASPDDLPTDAMAGLCRHLLLQRSFYPIFPPPQDLSAEVNLDVTHIDGVRMVDEEVGLDYAPDVLILPSRLKYFSKVVHSTTTINPSFLSKGTYGTISIAPSSGGTPKERVKAEVVKTALAAPAVGPSDTAAPTAPLAFSS